MTVVKRSKASSKASSKTSRSGWDAYMTAMSRRCIYQQICSKASGKASSKAGAGRLQVAGGEAHMAGI